MEIKSRDFLKDEGDLPDHNGYKGGTKWWSLIWVIILYPIKQDTRNNMAFKPLTLNCQPEDSCKLMRVLQNICNYRGISENCNLVKQNNWNLYFTVKRKYSIISNYGLQGHEI